MKKRPDAIFFLIMCMAIGSWTSPIRADSVAESPVGSSIEGASNPQAPHGMRGGGGGEVPTPFSLANSRVELADGETYQLVGRIVRGPSVSGNPGSRIDHIGGGAQAYFEVDLREQPWLANAKRRENPFYPLEGDWLYWSRFAGPEIKLTVWARGVAMMDARMGSQYVILLRPVPDIAVQSFP